jgi:hypothetical protein
LFCSMGEHSYSGTLDTVSPIAKKVLLHDGFDTGEASS